MKILPGIILLFLLVGVPLLVMLLSARPRRHISSGPTEIWFPAGSQPAGAELTDLYRTLCYRDLADELQASAQPCWRLTLADAPAEPGGSHFGGYPAMPAEFNWPKRGRHPMALLAQIRLDDLPPPRDDLLPASGLLCFFCDPGMLTGRYVTRPTKWWEVLYIEKPAAQPIPGKELGLPAFASRAILMQEQVSVPHPYALRSYDGLNHARLREVNEVHWQFCRANAFINQFLGHPVWHPDEMWLPFGMDSIHREAPIGWRPLLHIGGYHWMDREWRDSPRFCVWISEEELRDRRFENCVAGFAL